MKIIKPIINMTKGEYDCLVTLLSELQEDGKYYNKYHPLIRSGDNMLAAAKFISKVLEIRNDE